MRFSSVFAAAALVVGATAAPASHALHEKRDFLPDAWTKTDKLDKLAIVPVRIGLTQSNLDKGHDMLMGISDPDSPRYGKHMTAEEVHDFFAPSDTTIEAVSSWLRSAGIAKNRLGQSFNKQWLQFDAAISELEALIKAEFHLYEHHTGKYDIACEEYHVPSHLTEHIDYITPGVKLFLTDAKSPEQHEKAKRSDFKLPPLLAELPLPLASILGALDLELCDVVITPPCVMALYNITKPTLAAKGNELGIFEDLGDHYSQTDLNSFFESFASNIPQGTHPTLDAVDGATGPIAVTSAGPESDLDFQISYPIIYPQGSILFQTDDDVTENNYTYAGFLNNLLYAVDGSYCSHISPLDPPYPDPKKGGYKGQRQCGKYQLTNVLSISYGGDEYGLPTRYQQRQCNEFMKLGMQGHSVVVASGDDGVGNPTGGSAKDGCIGSAGKIFSPDFPATCPYLTTAGATYLPTGANAKSDQEVAVTRFASGGGFSNIYPIPSYQQSAVNTYLTKHTPSYPSYSTSNGVIPSGTKGVYNKIGRGYPDVAAVGDNIIIFNAGAPTIIGGTSASTPVFAAILNRINEERIKAGKSTIGFVNPTLYKNPSLFHDITTGDNPGCNTNGFSCAPGWDPVTGLGTPDYPKLLAKFLSLP